MEQALPDTQHLLLACLHDKAQTIFADKSTQALILPAVTVSMSRVDCSNNASSQHTADTGLSF
jgi:hypothetical protein